MKILGLTGGIGMGKSTAAAMLRRMGVPVFDADAAVHRFLGPMGAAVKDVAETFPGVKDGAAIDRKKLGAAVFGDPKKLRKLESILHPLVRRAENRFLRHHRAARTKLVVLDVPLLFETKGEGRCDAVAVVWAPEHLRRARVLRRPNMTAARLATIIDQQLPAAAKRHRADFAVPTGLGRAPTWKGLRQVVRTLHDACAGESRAAD